MTKSYRAALLLMSLMLVRCGHNGGSGQSAADTANAKESLYATSAVITCGDSNNLKATFDSATQSYLIESSGEATGFGVGVSVFTKSESSRSPEFDLVTNHTDGMYAVLRPMDRGGLLFITKYGDTIECYPYNKR